MATEMTNIKMLKDKGRTIIIITGADRERDEAAFKIASTYMLHQPQADASADIGATDCPPPIEEVQGLEAPAEKADDIPNNEQIAQMEDYSIFRRRGLHTIGSGAYKGMSPFEALQRDHEKALISLFNLTKEMTPCEERTEIISACKQYMANLPSTANGLYDTREQKVTFIQTVAGMTPITQFVNGYPDVDSFCSGATELEIDTTFYNLAWYLADRGCRA